MVDLSNLAKRKLTNFAEYLFNYSLAKNLLQKLQY